MSTAIPYYLKLAENEKQAKTTTNINNNNKNTTLTELFQTLIETETNSKPLIPVYTTPHFHGLVQTLPLSGGIKIVQSEYR